MSISLRWETPLWASLRPEGPQNCLHLECYQSPRQWQITHWLLMGLKTWHPKTQYLKTWHLDVPFKTEGVCENVKSRKGTLTFTPLPSPSSLEEEITSYVKGTFCLYQEEKKHSY